jgi:hypothetical protein
MPHIPAMDAMTTWSPKSRRAMRGLGLPAQHWFSVMPVTLTDWFHRRKRRN